MKHLTLLVLCLCLAAEAAPAKAKRPGKRAAASAVAPVSPLVVDIQELVPSLRPLGFKEREDQLRDWALYGLLMHLGLDADTLARTTHELAPVRLPYLEELFAFEYGRGRRAILSDEQVLLMYEQGDPDPQATLGRLADRVRMEMGTVPERFELYSFAADVTGGKLRVEFKESLPGKVLFSPLYGYQQAVVTDQVGLERWLGTVDDVVFVATTKKGLQLGGRRFEQSRTRGVTLEDVATLYQAHSSLEAQRQQQVDQHRETLERGEDELNASIPALSQELARLFPGDRAAQQKELNKRLNDRWREMQIAAREQVRPVPADPGFSLDPRLRAPGLAASLKELAADPCRALNKLKGQWDADTARLKSTQALPGMAVPAEPLFKREAADFRARCEALGKAPYRERLQKVATAAQALTQGGSATEALAPLRALRNELKDSKDETQRFLLLALDLAQSANGEQCARYDGPLGGTRVGMNLFYTDLLAKLWTLDVQHTAPGMRVPGFISQARLPPTAFQEEAKVLSYTRVWFGPRKEAFTRSPDDAELRFQHVATRVFAAGSDPDHPEYLEEAPAENSRRAVGWWERHFTDVADYEQEYHLQNQIMKWSAITGYFRARELAAYLEQVPVRRTEQFGKWFEQARPQLRYPLPLQVVGEVGRECMDLLSTPSGISGGVALAGTKLDRIRLVKLSDPPSLRHGLGAPPPPARPGPGELGRAFPFMDRHATVRVEPVRSTRTRIEGVQIEAKAFELAHIKAPRGDYHLSLRTEHASVGEFIGTPAPGQISLRWDPQDIAQAPSFVQRVTRNDGDAVSVAVTSYRAKGGTAGDFRTWDSRVLVNHTYDVLVPSARGQDYRRFRLSNDSSAHAPPLPLEQVFEGSQWQRISVDRAASGLGTSQGVVRAVMKTGPPAGAPELHLKGVEGFPSGLRLVADDGVLWVASPREPAARRAWVELDRTAAFTARELNEFLTAAANGTKSLQRPAANARAEQLARAIAGDDTARSQQLLAKLSDEVGPEQARQQAQRHLTEAGDFHLGRGNSPEATRLYDLARENFGDVPPAVQIRQSLAQLHRAKEGPESLLATLERYADQLPREERVKVMQAAHSLDDMPDVADVLYYKLHFQGPIPNDVVPHVKLEHDGPDMVSALRTEKPVLGKPATPDDVKKAIPDGATVYVEDGISANKNDFQASPAENVAELGRNPEVEVLRIQEMPSGTYRPGKVYTQEAGKERAYRRLAGPSSGQLDKQPVFYLRNRHFQRHQSKQCDTNGDGVVSEQELRQCPLGKCDANKDGVVSGQELRQCA